MGLNLVSNVFVHIGLGKTATTTLQHHVFRKVALECAYLYLGTKLLRPYLLSLSSGTDCPSFAPQHSTFISCEALVGWDPENWEVFADRNVDHFGVDAKILLILREPKSYLRSVYLQKCVHTGNLIEPERFFRDNSNYSSYQNGPRFNVEAFDYNRLIKIYSERFDTVIVQKFENFKDLKFLTEHFPISDNLQIRILKALARRGANRSYSQTAVDLTFFVTFGRKLVQNASYDRNDDRQFKRRLHHRVWRNFIQFGLDKVVPYKPFILQWNLLPMIDLPALSLAYTALPSYQVIESKTE